MAIIVNDQFGSQTIAYGSLIWSKAFVENINDKRRLVTVAFEKPLRIFFKTN